MNSSQSLDALATALSKAQSQFKHAEKNSVNPHFRSKFADLASIWDASIDALSLNGLSVTQTVQSNEKDVLLVTTLMHSSGQWMQGSIPLILTKNDMQGLGSAITYARRYSLAAILGISQDDDDAEKSMNRTPVKVKQVNDPYVSSIVPPSMDIPPNLDEPMSMSTENDRLQEELDSLIAPPFKDNSYLSSYVCKVGKKFKGKPLGSIPEDDLISYLNFFKGKPDISPGLESDLNAIAEYIDKDMRS